MVANPLVHSPSMADASTILSLRNIDGPLPAIPVPVAVGGIWRTEVLVSSAGFGTLIPHDRDTGLTLTNSAGGLLEVQAWSMVAHEPIKVTAQAVLASTPLGAVTADGYGLELTPMGDKSGFFLAYDRGQPGTGAPTTLYGQLVYFDGVVMTAGPQFAWDAVAHNCYRGPSADAFQQFSHQIVGLSSTVAVRFWFESLGAGSLAVRAQLIDFSTGSAVGPTITELGALAGEPTAGSTIPTFWAQRSEANAAVVYWTEAVGAPAAHVASFVVGPLWTHLPDPLVALGSSSGTLPYAFGSPNGIGEAYFAGFHPTSSPASAIDVIVHADATGAITESARRTQKNPEFDPDEMLSGLTNAIGVAPGAGSLTVDDAVGGQLLHLSLWNRFAVLQDKVLAVTDPTLNAYPGVLVAASVLQYGATKLVSMSDAMFLSTWTDHSGGSGSPTWFLTHARFAPAPRGALNVVNHTQKMRSKSAVRS